MFWVKKNVLRVILFCGSIFQMFVGRSQDTSNTIGRVSIASPNAASLGKYGDIPVSYNTGIPQISVPIYTVESGSIKLPVSLSYHAGGLKVQEQASWVGAGWSLIAGGMITRTVIGAPDDRGVGSFNACTNGHYADYGFNSYQFISGNGFGSVNGMVADDHNFETGVKDGEPDLYFFNFGGYSGKFYFNDDRTPVLVPEEDFKISPDIVIGSNKPGFQGFVITIPDGTKYYFGATGNNSGTDPLEITIPGSLPGGYTGANQAVSSWFLNKIISADGMDSITLSYEPESYSYYTLSLFPITNVITAGFLQPDRNGYNLVKNFVHGVRLGSIRFPNGSISFSKAASPRTDLAASNTVNSGMYDAANTEAYALGSISITDNKGFCKKDSFYYGYFSDSNPLTLNSGVFGNLNIHSDAYRLRLDSVQEISCDAVVKLPPYRFTYFPEAVPRKLSFGIDHWGFYNGVTSNLTLIPSYTLITPDGAVIKNAAGANRDAAWPAMRGGALQQITYPTGGNTSFVFEPNDTYVNYTQYTNTYRAMMSAGFDGHNGTLGDGGDNPDTSHLSSSGNSFQFVISNSTSGGSGDLQLFYAGTHTLAYNIGSIAAGHTDTFYIVIAPGNYWLELTKASASPGNGITVIISENVPSLQAGNQIVGGLRIKSIIQNDGISSNPITTSYSYSTGTQSSGVLYSRPVYVQTIRNDVYGLVYQPISGSNGCVSINNGSIYFISPGSITPMSTVQGNHIGYNEVQVSQTNNGYSVYRYYGSNKWDYIIDDVCTRVINTATCALTIPNFPAPPEPFEYTRGSLKYTAHYNQSGHVLTDATYTYTYAPDPILTPGIVFITVPGLYSYTGYNLQSAEKIRTQVVSANYDPGNSAAITSTSTIYYGSNFHHQPTRKVETTSTGDSLITNMRYAADFRISSCDNIPDSLVYYNNQVHADSVNLYSHINTCTAGGGWVCRYDTLQDFRRFVNLARIQYINYRRRSYSDPGNLLSACYLSNETSADTLLRPVLKLQNKFNNAIIEVSSYKNLNLLHATYIKYDSSLIPVGAIYPGRTELINLQTPSASFTNAAVSGNTITRDGRYLDESVYSFAFGKPVQVTAHDGVSNSYIWDYLNTEPVAKVRNAPADQIAFTSFESDGGGGWVYSGTPVTDTSALTGAKYYTLTGSNDISKSGLSTSRSFIVSYWSKSGSATVNGVTASSSLVKNGWHYYEHKLSAGITSVTLSGSVTIDELRLFPSDAQMTSYTYSPLIGMTSSDDIDNRITYYEYDGLGRLITVKDQDGNIIKTIQYHYANQSTAF